MFSPKIQKIKLISVDPDKIDNQVLNEINRRTTNEGFGRGFAFVINMYSNVVEKDFSSSISSQETNIKNLSKNKQRKAFSPQPKATYFLVNRLDLDGRFNDESNISNQIKTLSLVTTFLHDNLNQEKMNLKEIVLRRAKSPKIKNQVLASMMKKYTYKFLKNPFQISDEKI